MTNLLHRKNPDTRVVQAAPHPAGDVVNPEEYYMVDPPDHSASAFLVYPGNTHVVFYTAEFGNNARVDSHPLENWQQVERFLTESSRTGTPVANTPQQLIDDLRKKADLLEKWLEQNPQPVAADFQGMPYAGMKVWVEHPGQPGTLVHVKVTETCVMDGDMCVITEGWKYFRPGTWFWAQGDAEASLQKV